jgi:plastocyanin
VFDIRTASISWPRLLRLTALLELVLLAGVAIALLDREAMTFAVVVAATSTWLLRRPRSRVAVVVRGLVFLDVEFFMLPAAVSNIGNHEALGAVAAPLALAAVSAVGLVATVAFLGTRGREDSGGALTLALPAAALVAVVGGLGLATQSAVRRDGPRPGDLVISAASVKFSTGVLHARSGRVTVYMTNNDLFWHTFTSDDLRVNLSVPVKGHRSVTFSAPPGVYEFHCAIPGHTAAGMVGRIIVSGG